VAPFFCSGVPVLSGIGVLSLLYKLVQFSLCVLFRVLDHILQGKGQKIDPNADGGIWLEVKKTYSTPSQVCFNFQNYPNGLPEKRPIHQ